MTAPELTLTAIVYTIALMLGQRGIATIKPEAQEAAFALAAIAAGAAAGFLHYRRHTKAPPRRTLFIVGALLAALAILVGLFTQSLWQSMAAPIIALPLAAVGSFLAPLVMFPLVESAMGASTSEEPKPIAAGHVTLAAVALVAAMAGALLVPPTPRFGFNFITHQLPGVDVALPDWKIENKSDLFDYGNIKIADPRVAGHYLSLYWSDSDRVQPDDYLKNISEMPVIQRTTAFIGGHEGVTFFVQSSQEAYAMITIWNCPSDRRVMWLFSFLSDPAATRAVHGRVLETIRCHTGNRPQVQAVFPTYAAPPGFKREQRAQVLSFIGPKEETIAFTPASSARSPMVGDDVTPEKIASMLKGLDLMSDISTPPTRQIVPDVVGHERRVWSAVGTTRDGVTVQVDLMVWFCDKRNMTFLGAYRTRESHSVQEGIDVLLPAVCHTNE